MNCFRLTKYFISTRFIQKKVKSFGCLKPFSTDPSKTLHFKWILFIVHIFKIFSPVYTPGLSTWVALVGSQAQYGVKPEKVFKNDFSLFLNVPNVLTNELKELLFSCLYHLIQIVGSHHDCFLCKQLLKGL